MAAGLLLLLALAAGADPGPGEDRAQLGTVGNPLRVRVGVIEAERVRADVDRAWDQVARSLLDLEDALVSDLDAAFAGTPFTGRRRVRIEVEPELRVLVDVLPDDGPDDVRLRVVDGQGRAVQGSGAWLERGDVREPLTFAGAGEIVVEDLAAAESATVQILMGDGDVLVIWLGEHEEQPVP